MNRHFLCSTLAIATTPFAVFGADYPENPNRFSLGVRFGLNFKADFRNTPTPAPVNPAINPGPAAGGADHTYDDGYVRVDSSGGAGGLTWNWGYQNSSQVAGDSMEFHASQPNPSFGSSSEDVTDDPQYGVELTYQRVIAPILSSGRWGFEAALGYTDLDLSAESTGAGLSMVTTDTYPLNGVLPPGAGYAGTFAGPGALLGDTPTRRISYDTIRSHQELSGQLFGIRLGPFAEWVFTPQLSLSASFGLALAPASMDFEFSETTTRAGGGTSVASGHSSNTELLYGFYVSSMLSFDFNERWGLYLGAQFQSLNDMELSSGSHSVRLDQGATFYGIAGVSYRF